MAPANFGTFSNDLLIGNFGDGTVNRSIRTPARRKGRSPRQTVRR